eukprot:TRINITY_DN1509_c0_g2_i2.p1 TRINITY_DN1509_c0_g2~~TRINITY_DN1509_c0_g2_i2.p1  ORF type:complete len:570 (+),score=83.66 TRINITY_DN1509_c0_g2_i2:241-1710(+)
MYSGYIKAGIPPAYPTGQIYMHYWFVESENNPKTDPIVVWYNGGPGASSLYGLLVELGPLLLNERSLEDPRYNSTGIPQLIRNPYSWSKVANVLTIDNPAPVGFSYCDPVGPTGDGTSCGPWNDSSTAAINYKFFTNWFPEFSEFWDRELYVIGESYAGVYVPTIVRELVAQPPPGLNLRGFAVGDGCMGIDVLCGDSDGPYWDVEFMHGHGQFSNSLYRKIKTSCSEAELKNGNVSPFCQSVLDQMSQEIGGYYGYNLYDECWYKNIFARPGSKGLRRNFVFPASAQGALNDYACPTNAMTIWIDLAVVRKALNVPLDSYFFNGDNGVILDPLLLLLLSSLLPLPLLPRHRYRYCHRHRHLIQPTGVGFNYSSTERSVLPIYQRSIVQNNLKVLVYNGDTDPGINSFMTQDKYFDFFQSVGIQITERWRPWTLDGKLAVAGYVTKFAENFHFLTIRGSGHMVPEFKPAAALSFLSHWLQNSTFPPYHS